MSSREWKVIKLVSACTKIGSGITPRGGNKVYREQGVSLIRSQNIYDYSFDYSGLAYISNEQANKMKNVEVVREDVLLNITGDSVARCCMVPEQVLPARVNQHVSIIRTRKDVLNPKYLLYWINSYSTKELLLSLASAGGTRKALTKSMIENLEVNMPSIKEQVAISETLSCLDDMIELNDRTNRVLEEMAQVIFKYWFVDFEFPNKDGQPYKSSGGAMVDSELGEIPAGWRVGKLEDIANITMGQSPSGSSYNEEKDGIVFYQGRTDFGKRYPTIRLYTTEPKRLATKGDILLSVRAPVGDINLASEDCCIGRGLASLRSRDNCTSYLLYQLLNLRDVFNVYNTEGTVFGSINKNTLNNVPVLIPLDNHIHAFQFLVKKIDELIEIYSIQIRILTSIRDTLLPKLMSGEIRVPVEEVG
jgi:type I restriction enzyme S subunit